MRSEFFNEPRDGARLKLSMRQIQRLAGFLSIAVHSFSENLRLFLR